MTLSIVIISFNTKKLLRQCLTSVYQHPPSDSSFEVIVVDNASSDDSVNLVKTQFPQASLIQNRSNLGFAAANNQAIKQAKGELVFLLNSDAYLHPHSLDHLISFMQSHPRVGICSPQLLHPNGSIQPQGGALPGLINIAFWILFIDDLPLLGSLLPSYQQQSPSFFSHTQPTGWVAGTAMLIRHSLIKHVGTFDQKIFMYSEDTDFCLRAQQQRWQVWTVSSAQVTHLGHGSGSSHQAILGEYRGLIYLYQKHYGTTRLFFLKLLLKFGALLRMYLFGKIIKDQPKYEIYQTAYRLV